MQVWTSRARADARTPLCSACMHACAFLRPRIQTLVIPACAASCTLLPFTRNNKCFVFYAVRRHKRAFDACKRRTFLISSRASTSAQGSGKGHFAVIYHSKAQCGGRRIYKHYTNGRNFYCNNFSLSIYKKKKLGFRPYKKSFRD